MAWYATRSPRTTPPRTALPGRRSRRTARISGGTTNWAVQFTWPCAWLIIPGANPHSAPVTKATGRLSTRCRENSQYQPNAVPARPSTSRSANVTCGPHSVVSGPSGTDRPRIEVFAIRFTPSGTFMASEVKG
jgi:hypothetical protein